MIERRREVGFKISEKLSKIIKKIPKNNSRITDMSNVTKVDVKL